MKRIGITAGANIYEIRESLKKLAPNATESQLDEAVQEIIADKKAANGEGESSKAKRNAGFSGMTHYTWESYNRFVNELIKDYTGLIKATMVTAPIVKGSSYEGFEIEFELLIKRNRRYGSRVRKYESGAADYNREIGVTIGTTDVSIRGFKTHSEAYDVASKYFKEGMDVYKNKSFTAQKKASMIGVNAEFDTQRLIDYIRKVAPSLSRRQVEEEVYSITGERPERPSLSMTDGKLGASGFEDEDGFLIRGDLTFKRIVDGIEIFVDGRWLGTFDDQNINETAEEAALWNLDLNKHKNYGGSEEKYQKAVDKYVPIYEVEIQQAVKEYEKNKSNGVKASYEEPSTEEPSTEEPSTDDFSRRQTIMGLINDKWNNIQRYDSVMDVFTEEQMPVINSILTDEKVHIGQLQAMLDDSGMDTSTSIDKGREDAENILGDNGSSDIVEYDESELVEAGKASKKNKCAAIRPATGDDTTAIEAYFNGKIYTIKRTLNNEYEFRTTEGKWIGSTPNEVAEKIFADDYGMKNLESLVDWEWNELSQYRWSATCYTESDRNHPNNRRASKDKSNTIQDLIDSDVISEEEARDAYALGLADALKEDVSLELSLEIKATDKEGVEQAIYDLAVKDAKEELLDDSEDFDDDIDFGDDLQAQEREFDE